MLNAPLSEARHEEKGGLGTSTPPSKCPRGNISVIIREVGETSKEQALNPMKGEA